MATLQATNYILSYVDGGLAVNKAALTVTATDDSKTYDGLAYSDGNGVTYSGFVNSETNVSPWWNTSLWRRLTRGDQCGYLYAYAEWLYLRQLYLVLCRWWIDRELKRH